MKSIEEFDLKNMDLAVRYLNGNLSVKEVADFELRLEVDIELQEDLALAKEHLGFEEEIPEPIEVDALLKDYRLEQVRAERRALVGKDLITDGFGVALLAILMVLTCVVVLMIIGGE